MVHRGLLQALLEPEDGCAEAKLESVDVEISWELSITCV